MLENVTNTWQLWPEARHKGGVCTENHNGDHGVKSRVMDTGGPAVHRVSGPLRDFESTKVLRSVKLYIFNGNSLVDRSFVLNSNTAFYTYLVTSNSTTLNK